MLPKSQRLNLKKDFKWVREGRRVFSNSFNLMYRFSSDEYPKVGIALSKQYFKKATERNRARRLSSKMTEETFMSLRKGLKLVIIPKASILEKHPDELIKEFENVKDIFITN